jgi:hypothetical protein
MLIRMRHVDRRNREYSGWLVLEHGEANVFHLDDGTMTDKEVQQKYGGIIKGSFGVTASEWKRYLAKVGVKQTYEEPTESE